MIKKALIIVPHQDDELNISGGVLEILINSGVAVYVLYVTKGNFYKKKYAARQKERDNVLKIFGDIQYRQLEYDDSYVSEGHKYNDYDTRMKIKSDMKDYIGEVMADLIMCNDFDSHADHRMVSAIFDTIMCEMIREKNYRPIVLKKFAYLGVWGGENDYFAPKALETKPNLKSYKDIYNNSLPNDWNDRIQAAAAKESYGLAFWRAKLFRSYCTYWTQCGFRAFFRCSNSDAVYWYRNTHNLMISGASVSAASGNVSYVNDFCLANMDKINDLSGAAAFGDSAWTPDETDCEKELSVKWENPVSICTLKLYQNFEEIGHIKRFEIRLSNGYKYEADCGEGDVQYFSIPVQEGITAMTLKILDGSGKMGIRELEVYDDDGGFPWSMVPFEPYAGETEERRNVRGYERIAKIYWFVFRAINKVKKKLGMAAW